MAAKQNVPRLKKKYDDEIVAALTQQFRYKNRMQVPRVVKVVLNMGLGEATQNIKVVDAGVEQLAAIAGQKPLVTRSKRAIANFKLRAGLPIGCMVTLRRERMWEFLDRLLSFALPRVRDFRGINKDMFDGRGNCTIGLKEQIIFPEVNADKVEKVKGLNVCISTTARTDEEGRALMERLGMPFRN